MDKVAEPMPLVIAPPPSETIPPAIPADVSAPAQTPSPLPVAVEGTKTP